MNSSARVCAGCGRANLPDARFCSGCGKPIALRCPACGTAGEPDAQFCRACGASLAAPEDAAARVVVTIVFADLVGSTALHERLDAESVRRFMDLYYAAMRAAVEGERGTVTQLLGDGVKAVFGAPHVAEDDAIRAVRAAVAMQQSFGALAEEHADRVGRTGLRVAVNTGEVIASEGSEVIGDPVNVAARLQEEARDGDVVIGEATRRLVGELVTLAPLGSLRVKGRAEAVGAWRVESLERPAGVSATPFIGREDELRRLLAIHTDAVAKRCARLAVVLGSPGLGKSRLVGELARQLEGEATVLVARCDPAGGATFAPLAAGLRALLGEGEAVSVDVLRAVIDPVVRGDESDRGRIVAGITALLAGSPAPPEETFFVVRRFLAGLAATRPVVLAIDDLQWAEPLLLDLVEHLVQWSTDVPLLVLVAARPELRETRSSLATPGPLVTEVVTLAGLDAAAAMRLAASVIGAEELPAAVAGRVLTTSEGNPLFVGELVRMLVQDGALRREGDRWTTGSELAALEMPPTIQALLAARLERLRPEERTVLERAAIVGPQFSRAALKELLPRDLADLDRHLEALRRSELIDPDMGWFMGEPALRFHHVLVRDAAYRRVLKEKRAELHERFADWVAARVGEAIEHDETLGWHLEQAHQNLRELGPVDAHGKALGERAARTLGAAGRRALARDDVPLAASLLGRALERLAPDDPARADLALDWCEALLAAGEVGTAARAIDELGRFTEGSARLRAWHTCFAGERAALTDPQALRATAEAVAAAASELAAAGDAAGEAKAHFVHAMALQRLGQVGACEAALDRALAAARRGRGDRRRANAVLAGAPQAALWGPSSVTRASGRCLDVVRVLRITQGAPAVEAVALRCQGVLESLRGRSDAARRMIATSRRMVEELGITQGVLETEYLAGLIELIEGDPVAAEQSLRRAFEGLRQHGLGIDAARAAAMLGIALLAQGRAAEAEALSHESEALAGDDLQAAITWRRVRAEALARRGEHVAAVEYARAAVEIAAATDALIHHADARTALAAALRASGRNAEAAAEETRAIELWEAKGATLLAERARGDAGRAEQTIPVSIERGKSARRVRSNAATANLERLAAAFDPRNADTIESLLADGAESVHHPTRAHFDRQGLLTTFRSMRKIQEPDFRQELLATLGDSLALCRMTLAAGGFAGQRFDVGPYEREEICLVDVDETGRQRRFELFAGDRLGDAIARLYERYAELLPDDPDRERAAATARSVAALVREVPDCWPFAPDVEATDHRTVGFGSVRGLDSIVRTIQALLELGEGHRWRFDDVLGLRSDALLVRWTHTGTDRASSGAFERSLCQLWVFGADGLTTRWEQFDAEHDAEALARFDELTTGAALVRLTPRRVRPNAATAAASRLDAAVAARDVDAIATQFADRVEYLHHPTGREFDREGVLFSLRSLIGARDPTYRLDPLGTLGDSLALVRAVQSASGFTGRNFDVGAYEIEDILLFEVDARGRCRWGEFFSADRLGDAIARLYARHAELLPDGPDRIRAASIARSIAAYVGPFDLDRFAAALNPAVEAIDHRTLGTWSAREKQGLVDHFRSLVELADDVVMGGAQVRPLQPDALLTRCTHLGSDRSSGGSYERPYLLLRMFGPDGLASRIEWFDVNRTADALARFDALTAEPPRPARRVRPNAATAYVTRLENAIAARDAEAFPNLLAEHAEVVDHTTGASYDRRGLLASFRAMLTARNVSYRVEHLATLGDSLALSRLSVSASAFSGAATVDIGAFAHERIALVEFDAKGHRTRSEYFHPVHLGDAVARMYERYARLLPDGPERERAAAMARLIAACIGPFDVDRFATALAPDIESVDHRILGSWSARGKEALLENFRALVGLADDIVRRDDDVLGLRLDALLVRFSHLGTDRASGGTYERPSLMLALAPEGLATRIEWFDTDRAAEALARFDELTAKPSEANRRVRPNAATANADRLERAVAARDPDALPPLFADAFEAVDHTTGVVFDREGAISSYRSLLLAHDPSYRYEPLATLGDSLALVRATISASGITSRRLDVGAYQTAELYLIEVDAHGRRRLVEIFAADHLSNAIAGLYERYAELLPEGPERTRAAATARSVAAYMGPFEPDSWATALAPSVEFIDHRPLGLPPRRGAVEFLDHLRILFELADNLTMRTDDVLALRSDALLLRWTNFGTERSGGGAFEREFLTLRIFGEDGLTTREELFAPDRVDQALARFDEVTAAPPAIRPARRVRPNAATAYTAQLDAAIIARDADALPGLLADPAEFVDHTTGATYGRDGMLDSWRSLLRAQDPAHHSEPLATLGDALALCRLTASASGFAGRTVDVGPYQHEEIDLIEVDAQGRCRRCDRIGSFGSARLGDAVFRFYERYAERLPEGVKRARAGSIARSIGVYFGPLDADHLEQLLETLTPSVEFEDHRALIGLGFARGKDLVTRGIRTVLETIEGSAIRVDDVLALRPDALLVRATVSGTQSAGGGAYERQNLWLWSFDAAGRIAHLEWFDGDRDTEALVRFDALASPARRRVRPNAATAQASRLDRAIATRDSDAIPALFADEVEGLDHTTAATLDRAGVIFTWRSLMRARDPTCRHEPVATLGHSLALHRLSTSGSGFSGATFDVGAYEREGIVLSEVDAQGRERRDEQFSTGHLSDAVARLYECYAELLPEGPERERAAATARTLAAALGPMDLEVWARLIAPEIAFADRRAHGLVGSGSGAESWLQGIRSLLDVADGVGNRIDDVLALTSDALLARWTNYGTLRATGGAYERSFLWLGAFGSDGRMVRTEFFDLDREADALSRFDSLTAAAVPTRTARRVRPNAATANAARADAAVAARDAAAVVAQFADDVEVVDHQTGAEFDLQGVISSFSGLLSAENPMWHHEPLATLGDSLGLFRASQSGSRFAGRKFDVGPFLREEISLIEIDTRGNRRWLELFPVDRLGNAIVQLYERYAGLLPEGPARERAAAIARSAAVFLSAFDLDSLAPILSPAVEYLDHRTLGLPPRSGAKEYLDHLRTLFEIADDLTWRTDDVLALRSDAVLLRWTNFGTDRTSGGAFERNFLILFVLGDDGLVLCNELFDSDREAEALARFDALRPGPLEIPPNAASRAMDRVHGCMETQDWEGLRALCTPQMAFDERRRLLRTRGDRETFVANCKLIAKSGTRASRTLLATAGDRLALERFLWTGSRDGGPFEIEALWIIEVDAEGRMAALIGFDPDDRRAASIEMIERAAHGAPPWQSMYEFQRGIADHDLARCRAALPADFVFEDHRRTGIGRIEGADSYVESLLPLLEQSPDAIMETLYTIARERHGLLSVGRTFGTLADGGEFEIVSIRLIRFEADRLVGFEIFELDDLDRARARFAELRPDPLRIPPNAATRVLDRQQQREEARDWDALRTLCAPTMVFDDRRRLIRTTGDREMYVASSTLIAKAGTRVSRTLLATSSDRLALERRRWTGTTRDVGAFETDALGLVEVDADGSCVAAILFDPDDRRAASAEMRDRYAHGDEARSMSPAHFAFLRAFCDRDLEGIRRALRSDFALDDQRRIGIGRFENADDYLGSVRALFDETTEVFAEDLYYLAVEKHGCLALTRLSGALAEGGEFESVFAKVVLYDRERLARIETFEPEDLDRARARFAELRPDPLRIPPNAVTRGGDRFEQSMEARDWDALRALCAPAMVFEDRRRLFRTTGDREMFVANAMLIAKGGARSSRTLLATAGDRLALEHFLWTEGRDDGPFEIEYLCLIEVDAEGSLVAMVVFDPDDRRDASVEMLERTARSAPPWIPQDWFEFRRGLRGHDLARCRAALPDDFVFEDHRRTGPGRIEGVDGYLAWPASLFERSSDALIETLYTIAEAKHGQLAVARVFGTLAHGGEFESVFASLSRFEAGQFVGMELFELDDLDRARARFEELRPDPLRIPPNAASRTRDRTAEALAADDWAAVRALTAEDFRFEDRGKQALVSGGIEPYLESLRFLRSQGGRFTFHLVATAGERVAIDRCLVTDTEREFEIEQLIVIEVDAGGRYRAVLRFDPDDRRAAFEEAEARFLAGEAAEVGGQTPIAALNRAFTRHEWETLGACLAHDAVIRDRRAMSILGTLDRNEWVESMRVQADLAPDVDSEPFRILNWNRHGRVHLARTFGTRDGGAFENVYVSVFLTDGDRIQRYEAFDIDAADAALARFDELCANRS